MYQREPWWVRLFGGTREYAYDVDFEPASPEPVPTQVEGRLASSEQNEDFIVSVSARWSGSEEMAEAHVQRYLWEVAKSTISQYSVLRAQEAEIELNVRLADPLNAERAHLHLEQARATVTAEPSGLESAGRREELNRKKAHVQATRKQQLEHMNFVRDHLTADGVSTRLWWLDGDPEKLPELAKLEAAFASVISQLIPGSARDDDLSNIADLIQRFLDGLGPGHLALVLSQLGSVFVSYERSDLNDLLKELQQAKINGQAPL